jgi:hypothetical protein
MTTRDILATKTIVAIPDLHTSNAARRAVQTLIGEGIVNTFFMEFQRSAKTSDAGMRERFGTTLNAAISNMLDDGADHATATESLGTYFVGLAGSDASPTLKEITATAIANGVQVLACDMDYAGLPDEFAKRGESRIASPAGPVGLSIRDEATAKMVANYLRVANKNTGCLMLWGANHFTENTAFGRFPDERLQTLLEQQGLSVHVASGREISAV